MQGIEDLRTYATIGQALWADPETSKRVALETFAATRLMELPAEREIEKATATLLGRAQREGIGGNARANPSALSNAFFRLEPRERVILSALHAGSWSYSRLSRITGLAVDEVERLAWRARIRLASSYPAGASPSGPRCPEYEADRPWTQRFLDDEVLDARQRLFLRNHLMACAGCRDVLSRCRALYYEVERGLPVGTQERDAIEAALARASEWRMQRYSRLPRTWLESFGVFLRRRDIQVALAILLGVLARWIFF